MSEPEVVQIPIDGTSTQTTTYRQILASSAWIGGAAALNIGIGIVRTKAMAMLLGPAGFGLMGAFTAIVDLTRSVAEMGINNSGVRQIAESAGSGDAQRIARTAAVLRRTAWLLGAFGALLLIMLSGPIAELTFGDRTHATAVALLSLAVFLRLVADAQGALVQGLRRIADVAKISVLAALLGAAVSVPLVYWLRFEGIALAVVAMAVVSAVASWWYSRKVKIERPSLTATIALHEASALLRLGLAFMASGLLMMGAAYVVRLILIRELGLDAAGLYQAAWTLGGLYVGFLLQSMGADFYPRLVGVAKDHAACNQLVNEQTHVSLLLAGAGVLATIALSPLVVTVFYSAEFAAAAETLRWICLGMALRIISWPMGYIIVARGEQTIFFATELAWTVVNVGLSWLFIGWFGLKGAGIAFFASYVFHVAMIYPIVRRIGGFRWTATTARIIVAQTLLVALTFLATQHLTAIWSSFVCSALFICSAAYLIRSFVVLMPTQSMPRAVVRLTAWLKITSARGRS